MQYARHPYGALELPKPRPRTEQCLNPATTTAPTWKATASRTGLETHGSLLHGRASAGSGRRPRVHSAAGRKRTELRDSSSLAASVVRVPKQGSCKPNAFRSYFPMGAELVCAAFSMCKSCFAKNCTHLKLSTLSPKTKISTGNALTRSVKEASVMVRKRSLLRPSAKRT